jgi:hypothetical protein
MTIPITPGPFSFLAELGRAGGAAVQAAEGKRDKNVKEAQDRLNEMVRLRQLGIVKADAFGTPEAQKLYKTLGIMPEGIDKPTYDENVTGMKNNLLTQLSPSLGAGNEQEDDLRALTGLPSRATGPKVTAEIAGSRADVPQAQMRGAMAIAGLPQAAPTVVAGQQQEQDKQYNSIADRVVEDLYTKTKKMPTSAEAMAVGQQDERTKPFGTAITEPYYGQALERLRAKLADEDIKRKAAAARLAGASGTGLDDLAKIYQNQQTRITAEMNALQKPSASDLRIAAIAAENRTKGKPVSAIFADAETRVGEYNRRRGELDQQQQQLRDQLNQVLAPAINAPGRTPPGTTGAPNKRAAAVEFEQQTQGITDPAKRKAIAAEIAKKYNLNGQETVTAAPPPKLKGRK